ncbi:hypothetical protein D3C80_1624100 [compost metagenome]
MQHRLTVELLGQFFHFNGTHALLLILAVYVGFQTILQRRKQGRHHPVNQRGRQIHGEHFQRA